MLKSSLSFQKVCEVWAPVPSVKLSSDLNAFFSNKIFNYSWPIVDKNHLNIVMIVIYNNGFIFLLAPIDYRLPVKIIHIEKHSNGNYNSNIDDIASNIVKVLRKNGLRTYLKWTDGDHFLSKVSSTNSLKEKVVTFRFSQEYLFILSNEYLF